MPSSPRTRVAPPELAADVRRHAERLGTDTAIGEALRARPPWRPASARSASPRQAVTYLEASPCQYEHAAARVEYGILARSASELNRGLTLADSCGADGLVRRAKEALDRLG